MCPPVLAPIWEGIIICGVTRDESLSKKTLKKNITKYPSSHQSVHAQTVFYENPLQMIQLISIYMFN